MTSIISKCPKHADADMSWTFEEDAGHATVGVTRIEKQSPDPP